MVPEVTMGEVNDRTIGGGGSWVWVSWFSVPKCLRFPRVPRKGYHSLSPTHTAFVLWFFLFLTFSLFCGSWVKIRLVPCMRQRGGKSDEIPQLACLYPL